MEELLIPRHPLDKSHQAQLAFLAALPEAQRAEHARLFRLGNATYRYQQQAQGEVTEEDFHHWLAGLPEKIRVVIARDGFEASKNSWPLRRHALERRDLGQDAFLEAILSPEDWAYQQQVAYDTKLS
ncbi:hypothetical protein FNT36_25150 [Hymenobacter setariae]|uniref:Uncharacterized protein n=1 Tax=Hymenobacter setariae TaxID=2594794 RepID=A0A558BJY1_9BACT|nr:hypothetical protein [Hymenobacter setariae]TVT36803.1 hypothetical protein FNT36_25150 [Hymenobacter setariae]